MQIVNEIDDWCCKSLPKLGIYQAYGDLCSGTMVAISVGFIIGNLLRGGAHEMLPMVSKVLLVVALVVWVATDLIIKYFINETHKFLISLQTSRRKHSVHSELMDRITKSKDISEAIKDDIQVILNNRGFVNYGHLFYLDGKRR